MLSQEVFGDRLAWYINRVTSLRLFLWKDRLLVTFLFFLELLIQERDWSVSRNRESSSMRCNLIQSLTHQAFRLEVATWKMMSCLLRLTSMSRTDDKTLAPVEFSFVLVLSAFWIELATQALKCWCFLTLWACELLHARHVHLLVASEWAASLVLALSSTLEVAFSERYLKVPRQFLENQEKY